jgi:hypothetical protein
MYPADECDSNLVVHSPAQLSELLYFPVSLIKFAVLSICTFGLYEFYWFYKNWQRVKEREHSDIMPFWRAFFAFFFCYSLFRRIGQSAKGSNLPSISAGGLVAGWIIVRLLYRLPNPYSLVCFFAFLFLMPIQQTVNKINTKHAPNHDPNSRFRAWNVVAVVVGGICFVLAIIGSFLPP